MKFKLPPLFLFTLFFFVSLVGYAQILRSGSPENMFQVYTSSISDKIGFQNNKYYIIEKDYGKVFDFKNNILSKIVEYDLGTLNSTNSLNLNKIVEPGTDEDKIIFNSIFRWNNKIVGFYTKKGNATRRTFTVYGRFFDDSFNPSGEIIELGEADHNNGNNFGQSGLLVNGRDKLAVADKFDYRISPDSSKFLMLCSLAKKSNKNIMFKLFDKNLNHIDNISASIPLKNETATLYNYKIDNNGNIYILAETYVKVKDKRYEYSKLFELHIIDAKNFNAVSTIPISDKNYSILTSNLLLDRKGLPTIIGSYKNQDGEEYGNYCLKINPITKEIQTASFKESKELRKYLGIGEKNEKYPPSFSKFMVRPDGGIYAINQALGSTLKERGSTGAFNTYLNSFGNIVYTFIDSSGNVKWWQYQINSHQSKEYETVTGDYFYFFRNGLFFLGFNSDNAKEGNDYKRGVKLIRVTDDGIWNKELLEFPNNVQSFRVVPSTFGIVDTNTYILSMYKPRDNNDKSAMRAFFEMKIDTF